MRSIKEDCVCNIIKHSHRGCVKYRYRADGSEIYNAVIWDIRGLWQILNALEGSVVA